MTNKRDLKKMIRYTCGDIAAECIIANHVMEGIDKEKMSDVVVKVACIQELTLSRVSFNFDKVKADFASSREYNKAKSIYYKKAYSTLLAEFNEKIANLVKEMNDARPK